MAKALNFQNYMRGADEDKDSRFFELANSKLVQYAVAGSRHLEIEQDTSLHDCCGGIIWETSFVLAAYLEQNLEARVGRPLRKVKVVELGAGCGLLGLRLASMKCKVVLTDVDQVLPLMVKNISRNESKLMHCPVALPLDWECTAHVQAVAEHGPFDVVVATDVVFAARLVRPLLESIKAFSVKPNTLIWVCIQERCAEAFTCFMKAAEEDFEVKRIPVENLIEFADQESVLLELSRRCDESRRKEASVAVLGEKRKKKKADGELRQTETRAEKSEKKKRTSKSGCT